MLQHEPRYAFAARWRRERTGKRIVRMARGQQIRGADRDGVHYALGSLCLRQVGPQRLDTRILLVSAREQHSDYRKAPARITMYQVRDHVVALAVHFLFTRPVKVKLLELVLLAADADEAARLVVDLDGVAVVDDLEFRGLVMKFKTRKVGLPHGLVLYVDRRLRLPHPASAVVFFHR